MAKRFEMKMEVGSLKVKVKKATKDVADALPGALIAAGLHLQRESQKVVPVDTSALRNSAFTRETTTVQTKPTVEVGYTMFYALFVHEGTARRPGPYNGWKFLETPFREGRKEMLAIVKRILRAKALNKKKVKK